MLTTFQVTTGKIQIKIETGPQLMWFSGLRASL